ncbi:21 kDa subunit of NADH dehydrogenase [Trichodelitschia bisporula]|uniref:21 kDa subunit of NADH dehydrogenase n=1 Tax=Trichodelitschia bisporula TaxID=703511 RepID=A0A6G1HSV8_9PEZI|nr:21 kDa subunit of NADH dehydrogenase [Trichodelitschia bisporula]
MSAGRAVSAVKSGARSAGFKKYTVQPTGFWGFINRIFAVDPKRSTGIPLNPQFRNPPPGALDPATYDDPFTVPAADIAENAYWKRDMRRRYPQLSAVTQGDVVALLTVGSKAAPREDVLQIGEAGTKQLVAAKQESLATYFAKETGVAQGVLGPDGQPPLPAGQTPLPQEGYRRYTLLQDQSYEGDYPCRTFH